MGAQNSLISDNGIQNLNRSEMLTVQFKKESYYEGQLVEGVIIFEPKQSVVLNDILIKFHQSEYFVYVIDEKNTISEINSNVFFEKPIGAANYLNMGGGPGNMISLNPGSYKFPFQFTLPNDIPPSFEYPFRNRRASLRYTFSVVVVSPYVKTTTESYIWIKARPINIPDQIKHESYVTVKNVGIVSRGKSGISLFTMANNYRINDMLPFTVDIHNEDCGVQVKEVKISIKRMVTFVKDGKQYQQRTAIMRKKYPCLCYKNTKNSYHYDDLQIRDSELKDADFNRTLNPYPFIDDLNLLMPNMRSKLIKCEYSLKATSYFDLSVLGKDRPRVEMPIYITHQLQKEYDYEKNTNQNNGQGQEFAARNFQRGFSAPTNNSWGNNNNNNNNNFGSNNNNFGSNNNDTNQYKNYNMNNQSSSLSTSTAGTKKFSYEAYIASKKLNNQNNNNNKGDWRSKTTIQSSSYGNNNNFNNNNPWENNNNNNNNFNNNNPWGNNNNNNNNPWGNNNNNNNNNNPWSNNNNNNNNNPWGNNNNNNNNNNNPWGNNNSNNNNNNPWGNNNNNNNNNPWGNNNNNNNSNPWGNNNNSNNNNNNPWGNNNNNNNNNNPWGNNNNNNSNNNPWGNNNNQSSRFGPGKNGSANPFEGGNNDFPSLDNINSSTNNNNNPPNPFGNNNNPPPNPFGNNNGPQNPFGNNNNNPPNPFGNNNQYPGF